MNKSSLEKVQQVSANVTAEQAAALKTIFPEVFSEGLIDWDELRSTLGTLVDDQSDRYLFGWSGKKNAIRLLQAPTRATLVPTVEESTNFDTTQNVFIEGENLEALKLLYKPYFGLVKMIYIDPPYNTGNDFIYSDNFTAPLDAYLQQTGQQDASGNPLTSSPETRGRYHSAWLSMMYPRLFLARQLLREDGAIFISIDDHEVHDLRMLMNEVFGEENFIASVIWQKMYAPKSSAKHFSEDHDYIVVYARNAEVWRPTLLPRTEQQDKVYKNPDNDPRGLWRPNNLAARNYYSKGTYSIRCPGGRVINGPPKGSYWRVAEEKLWQLHADGRIWWGEDGNNVPAPKIFLSEVMQGRVPQTLWTFNEVGHTQEAKKELLEYVQFEDTDNVLDTVKPTRLIQKMLQLATTPDGGDIVLDFFAGSATTAHAVLKQNAEDEGDRHFICVQIPEMLPTPETQLRTIADIGKERIRGACAKLQAAHNVNVPEGDWGVRVFKLAESNYRPWQGVKENTLEAYASQMALFTDPLREGWQVNRVIWEVAIKEGYALTSQVEQAPEFSDNVVYRVTDLAKGQSFLICLDQVLAPQTVASQAFTQDDLFICRDVALSDEAAANLALNCRLKTI